MKRKAVKIEKVESILSQKITDVYQSKLEHQPEDISYKLFDHTLIITLSGIITSPEKLLQANEHYSLAKQVRETVDNIIHPQIKEIVEEVLDVKVVDFLSDTTIDHNITGAIAVFEFRSKDVPRKIEV